jgi:hypothetical protein
VSHQLSQDKFQYMQLLVQLVFAIYNSDYSNRNLENYESQDMVFAALSDAETFNENIWFSESGASSHYCALDTGMFDVGEIN